MYLFVRKYLSDCVELDSIVLVHIVLLVTFSTIQSTEGAIDSIAVVVGSADVLGGGSTTSVVVLLGIALVVFTMIGASSIGDVSLVLCNMLSVLGIYLSVSFCLLFNQSIYAVCIVRQYILRVTIRLRSIPHHDTTK